MFGGEERDDDNVGRGIRVREGCREGEGRVRGGREEELKGEERGRAC